MGMEANLVKTDWGDIIPALLEGKCAAIVASMSITKSASRLLISREIL